MIILIYGKKGDSVKKVMKSIKKTDKTLLILSVLLFIFGLLMIFSASSISSFVKYGESPYYYFIKQGVFLAAGLFLFGIISTTDTRHYYKVAEFFMIVIIAVLGGLLIYGQVMSDVKSWIPIPGFGTFQPSEIAKVFSILYLSVAFERHKKNYSVTSLTYPLVIALIPAGLTILQPDLGTGVIIILIVFFMFLAVPAKRRDKFKVTLHLFFAAILLLGGFILSGKSMFTDTQSTRFNFLKPCTRYTEPSGHQVCNSFIAINNGGLLGLGLGNSTQKYLYLPESHNDFIFPVIIEELGLVVGIVVILLFMVILYRILVIARKASSLRGELIAYGVFIFILGHIIINLAGVLGLAPMTGLPLPFLSYGGSFCLSLIMALSMAQRVEIETRISNETKHLKR